MGLRQSEKQRSPWPIYNPQEMPLEAGLFNLGNSLCKSQKKKKKTMLNTQFDPIKAKLSMWQFQRTMLGILYHFVFSYWSYALGSSHVHFTIIYYELTLSFFYLDLRIMAWSHRNIILLYCCSLFPKAIFIWVHLIEDCIWRVINCCCPLREIWNQFYSLFPMKQDSLLLFASNNNYWDYWGYVNILIM